MTTTTLLRRQAIRAAVKIHEHLAGPARHGQGLALPQTSWDELCQAVKRLGYAERKGWQAASQALIQDIEYSARCVQREMDALRQCLSARSTPSKVVSASEMAADLMALADEFDNVAINLTAHSVSAVTTSIELDGIHLGPFRIALSWQQIGSANCYRCYAQEPYHPEGREDVTHPHVLDNQLCEGEGAASIKAALTGGRLFDFFVLVRQILGTYNPESAHVQLSDWGGGYACDGCGSSLSEDEYSLCDRCSDRFCDECSWLCEECERCVCSGCSDYCAQCSQRYCRECLDTPADSKVLLCEKCLEASQKDPSHDSDQNAPAQAPATILAEAASAAPAADPVCVGQAAIPPRPRRNGSRRVRRQPAGRPAARRRRASGAARVHARNG